MIPTLTPRQMADILTIAMEGAINYWCLKVIHPDPLPKTTGFLDTPWYANPTFYAQDNWSLYFIDLESETKYLLTKAQLETLPHFLSQATTDYATELLEAIQNDNIDADDADILMQLALFGEVEFG